MRITCVCAFALVLNIIGLSVPYWLVGPNTEKDSYMYLGLWEICAVTEDSHSCMSMDGIYIRDHQGLYILRVVRAMELLGMLSCFAALVLALNKEFNIKLPFVGEHVLGKRAAIVGVIAGGFMLVGVIAFAAGKHKITGERDIFKLHAGFGLCIVSSVLSIASGVLYLSTLDGSTTNNTV